MTLPIDPGSAGQDPTAQGGTGSGEPIDPAQPADPPADPQGKTAAQLEAELAATRNRMQAADRNNAALQAKLKLIEDANLSETEKLKRDFEAMKAEKEALEQRERELRIEQAFVTDNTYSWHNPRAALKLADLSDLEIDDKGTVKGLKEALKAVADANPWMIKTAESAPAGPTGSTGVAGQGTGGAAKGDPTKADLEKKFPALRGRVS